MGVRQADRWKRGRWLPRVVAVHQGPGADTPRALAAGGFGEPGTGRLLGLRQLLQAPQHRQAQGLEPGGGHSQVDSLTLQGRAGEGSRVREPQGDTGLLTRLGATSCLLPKREEPGPHPVGLLAAKRQSNRAAHTPSFNGERCCFCAKDCPVWTGACWGGQAQSRDPEPGSSLGCHRGPVSSLCTERTDQALPRSCPDPKPPATLLTSWQPFPPWGLNRLPAWGPTAQTEAWGRGLAFQEAFSQRPESKPVLSFRP